MSQLIAIDIGNSAIKVGIERGAGSELQFQRYASANELSQEILGDDDLFWSVCSVNETKCLELRKWQQANRPHDRFHVISESEIPIVSNVEDRGQVGRDRLVAAWTAYQSHQNRFPGSDLVVVDAGTAVTIDLVDKHGVFQGGVIFPGAATNLTSLANATQSLPDLSKIQFDLDDVLNQPIGKNTHDAILSGVLHSQLSSIFEIAKRLSGDAKVVATGGQTQFLSQHFPNSWKINDRLILQGALELGKLASN